jgi:hypothetical protein
MDWTGWGISLKARCRGHWSSPGEPESNYTSRPARPQPNKSRNECKLDSL